MNSNTTKGSESTEATEQEPLVRGSSPIAKEVDKTRDALHVTAYPTEAPQKWLNQDQEWAYAQFSRFLQGMNVLGAREWIIELFQPEVDRVRGTPLELTELDSVTIEYVEGKSASKIAGTKITRPVIHFSDIGEYQRFCSAWRGEEGMSSRGMSMEMDTQNGPVSLLFACGPLSTNEEKLPSNAIQIGSAEEYIEHEITHSIDPNLHRRTGYDQVLCEALTYFDSIIANPRGSIKEPNWGFYGQTLKGHFESWSADNLQEWNRQDYEAVCRNLVDSIRLARSKCGDLEVQRMLAKSRTVQHFMESCNTLQ